MKTLVQLIIVLLLLRVISFLKKAILVGNVLNASSRIRTCDVQLRSEIMSPMLSATQPWMQITFWYGILTKVYPKTLIYARVAKLSEAYANLGTLRHLSIY